MKSLAKCAKLFIENRSINEMGVSSVAVSRILKGNSCFTGSTMNFFFQF